MDYYMNEELREKPNHAHFPICRGRMDGINANCFRVFLFTLVSGVIMGGLSLFRIPLHVVGWIPMIFNSEEISKGPFNISQGFALTQALCCGVLIVFASLNMGKRKIFGEILFFIYFALLLSSLLASLSGIDVATLIIAILGVYYCSRSFKDKRDYEQLSETEGFPNFSVVLAESDDKYVYPSYIKTRGGMSYYNKVNKQSSAPAVPVNVQPIISQNHVNSLSNMPSLDPTSVKRSADIEDKFRPRSGKEEIISFSPLKLK